MTGRKREAPPCYPVCSGRGGRNCDERDEHRKDRIADLCIDPDEVVGSPSRFYLRDCVLDTYVCSVTHCPWCGSKLLEKC